MGKFILITIVLGLMSWARSASIDCESSQQQCKKISLLYQEIGCKAIKTSKSCCPKRFECPDLKKSDDANVFYIRRGCLPVFHADKDKPVDWKCPAETKEEEVLVKKIVKRSSPSGNLEAFLKDVRPSDDDETTTTMQPDMMMDTETTTTTMNNDMMKSETSTLPAHIPTLSLDPFLGPIEDSTIPVSIKYDDERSTTQMTFVTTQMVDSEITTPSISPAVTDETSTEKFTTFQSVDSDVTTSTTETAQTSQTETARMNDETTDKMMTTTDSTTTTIQSNTNLPQPRELDIFNIPHSLAAAPIKPAIISASPETVRATPSELSSILSALRDILAKVESLAMSSMDEKKIHSSKTFSNDDTTVKNHFNRKRRSVVDPIEEVKQKYVVTKGCNFNDKFFKVGEKITSVNDECLECFCEYAPIGHCVVKKECPL